MNKSSKRPDIIIFDYPFAFSDNDANQSIVIIEFKKPMRENYDDTENPINQIYDYIKTIKNGQTKDFKGRPIDVKDNTPFYCYIICDINEKIKDAATKADFTKTPDELGYFNFSKNFNAYIEIISYNKLLKDSKQRNRILFDKLNLQ